MIIMSKSLIDRIEIVICVKLIWLQSIHYTIVYHITHFSHIELKNIFFCCSVCSYNINIVTSMTNVWHQIELITKWWGVQVLEECSADNTALKLIDCEISDPHIKTIHITWDMKAMRNFTLSHVFTPHWVYKNYFLCHNIPETLPMLYSI